MRDECPRCLGAGTLDFATEGPDGTPGIRRVTCDRCGGEGLVMDEPDRERSDG